MPVEPGQSLLHYRLVEKIGEGGMGVVWKAVDTTLDRPVAIKLLPPAFAEDPDRLARFEREAKLLAALNHPNIASIFSVHRAEGEHFIALELVEGEDLATRTAQGPLPVEDALQVCLAIAEALEAAHQAGVVHRDLKPANVKLSADGKVKVLDFGLAKAVDSQAASSGTSPTFAPTVTSAGTRAGVILGTAAYMSPEQARGKPLDPRTDLWSFGCVLYECLTGIVLFRGETVSDSLAAILRQDPDWSKLPPETPASVRKLLERCLTRDVSRRQQSAGDARVELLEAIEDPRPEIETSPVEGTRGGRLRLGVTAAMVAAGLIVGWLVGSRFSETATQGSGIVRATIGTPAGLRMTYPKLTPDGTTLVVRARDLEDPEGNYPYRIYVRRLDEDAIEAVEGPGSSDSFSLSPDGGSIAFSRTDVHGREGLYRVPIDLSTPPQHLADLSGNTRQILWLDDTTILSIDETTEELLRFSATGGPASEPVPISGDPAPFGVQLRDALPDGRHVLVRAVSFESGVYLQYIGVLDTATAELTRVIDDGSYPHYLNSGHIAYTRADQLMVVPFDPATLRTTGTARVVLGGLWASGGYTGGHFSVSDNGHLAYLAGTIQGPNRTIALSDRDGNLAPWSEQKAEYNQLHPSPDGARLAAQVDNTSQGDALLQIRLSEMDRPRFVTVGAFPGFDCTNARWSPDSSLLAFECQDQNVTRVHVLDPHAPESSRRVLETAVENAFRLAGFTSDGAHLLATRQLGGNAVELISFPASPAAGDAPGENVTTVPVEGDDLAAAGTSKDGRYLLYISRSSGRREMFLREVIDATTVGPHRTLGFEKFGNVAWSNAKPGGAYELLLFTNDDTFAVTIETEPTLRVGTPTRLPMDAMKLGLMYSAGLADGRLVHIIAPDSENGSSEVKLILDWASTL